MKKILKVRAINRWVRQQKPWNQGPKPGTLTAFEQGRAAGIPVNVLNIKPRLWKKTMTLIADFGRDEFNGRNQRRVLKEYHRELWQDAEDCIYGGP